MLKTPLGRPASVRSSAIRLPLSGTCSLGLNTIVLPRANAIGMVQCGTIIGKLNGVMHETTPIGACWMEQSNPGLTSSDSPETKFGKEQASSVSSIALSTSAFDSPIVFPFSSWQIRASSSRLSCSRFR